MYYYFILYFIKISKYFSTIYKWFSYIFFIFHNFYIYIIKLNLYLNYVYNLKNFIKNDLITIEGEQYFEQVLFLRCMIYRCIDEFLSGLCKISTIQHPIKQRQGVTSVCVTSLGFLEAEPLVGEAGRGVETLPHHAPLAPPPRFCSFAPLPLSTSFS